MKSNGGNMKEALFSILITKNQFKRMTAMLVGLGLGLAETVAWGTNYTFNTAGDWATTTTWSPNGVPGAGDKITINKGSSTITVSSDQQFGGSGITNSWTDPGGFLSINSGVTLTHNAGGVLAHNAYPGYAELGGAGTFRNLGVFSETRNGLNITGTLIIENPGTLSIGGNTSGFNLAAGTTLRNLDGTIQGIGTGTGGAIYGSGVFTTVDGGSVLRSVKFVVPSGYTLPVTVTAAGRADIAGSSAVDGLLQLAGAAMQWSGTINGTGGVKLTSFQLGGDLAINTTGAGAFGDNGTCDLRGYSVSLNNAQLTALNVGDNFTWTNGTLRVDSGSTMTVSRGNLQWKLNSMIITNAGTFVFKSTQNYVDNVNLNAGTTWYALDSTITSSGERAGGAGNVPVGQFQGVGTFTTRDGAGVLHSVTLNVDSNAALNFTSSGVADGRISASSTVNGGLLLNGGTKWQGTVNGSGYVGWNTLNLSGDLSINVAATGAFNNATANFGGYRLSLNSGVYRSNDTGPIWTNGNLTVGSTASLIYERANGYLYLNGMNVDNYGTFVFKPNWGANATVNLQNGYVFNNYGLLTKVDNSYTGDGGVLNNGTFYNYGTVQVLDEAGTSTLTINSSLGQLSSGTLTGGTWKASGVGTVLNLSGGNITNIGSGATVILEDGGAINTINTALKTVQGRFMVNGMNFATGASGLAVTNGGVLGGSGSISGNVSVAASSSLDAGATVGGIGTLSITGTVTLASEAGIICDYDGTTGDTVVVTGTLTLPAAMTVTTVGTVKPTFPMTILSSTNLVGGVSGWTIAGPLSEEKLLIEGNTVVIAERLSGTVLICQ